MQNATVQQFDTFLPTGVESLDRFLGGGWLKGAVSELTGPPGGGKTTLAVKTAVRLTTKKEWVAWITREPSLFPPALAAAGLALPHLLWLRPKDNERCRWALQQVTQSGLFPLILAQEVHLREKEARRLQLAAEERGVSVLLLSIEPKMAAWPIALRCEVTRLSTDTLAVRILHTRKHLLQLQTEVHLNEETHPFHPPLSIPRARRAS